MRYFLLTMWALFSVSAANYPVFEGANQLKRLLVPADVHIGSVIYRLRASDHDHDYPLQFDATDYGSYVVRVENLPCIVNATYCEANVFLDRVLVAGQTFKFRFTVRDTKGDTTTASASVEVTNAPVDITAIFPHMPGIIVIPEDTKVGTELEYVIARRHAEHKKATLLEIRGSTVLQFGRTRSAQETTTGVITLTSSVDFEQQNMYKLQIFALDMYTDKLVDSRNIAGFDLLLIIQDVQDTPPIFTRVEPTIKLRSNLTQGDVITKVIAVDGDRGNPRRIKYGLVSESNPFTIFFNIDRITGQLTLAKPLKQLTAIARSHQPIMVTIVAEEERLGAKEPPSMSTTATIALLLAEAGNTPPYFDNDNYVCYLNENSPQGTALVFSDAYSTQVHDDDMGKQGVFSLQLEQNNGTFEITPNVVERKAHFTIRVRNKALLDYEVRQSVEFVIVARELDPGSLSSTATVLVYLNDVNDNAPQFQRTIYRTQIPENVTANALVAEVKATDMDTGLAGSVHYTRITGYRNSSLLLNSITGVITVATDNHGFDREEASEYQMTIEARDMEGTGLLATVPLIIRVLDVNDQTPVFENTPIHFTLTADMKNFSTRAFIKATDKDAEPPNNVLRYEITSGNYNDKFILDAETGELTVRQSAQLTRQRKRRQTSSQPISNVYVLIVRVYDLGVPVRWESTEVRIFPPETGTRLMNFLMPARGFDYAKMEELLIKMTGGQVTVVEINPYRPHRQTRAVTETSRKLPLHDTNMVVTRVTYGDNTVIDIERVYYLMQTVFAAETIQKDQVELQTAGTGVRFYWILVILILLLIALLIVALLCYLWKCCPVFDSCARHNQKNQVSGSEQTVNFLNKGVQANNRAETRSSTDSSQPKRGWKFYRHREPEPQPQPVLLISKGLSPVHYRNTTTHDDIPGFIYRTNLADISSMEQHGDLYIQDIAETEYRILDPAKLNVQRINEQSSTETRKFTDPRRSEDDRRRDVTPADREESFVREGDAEILRLRTNEERVRLVDNLPHRPDNRQFEKYSTSAARIIESNSGPQPESFSTAMPTDTGSKEDTLLGARQKRQTEPFFVAVPEDAESKETTNPRKQPEPIDDTAILGKFIEIERASQATQPSQLAEDSRQTQQPEPDTTQPVQKKEKLANGVLPSSSFPDHADTERIETSIKPTSLGAEPSQLQAARDCETIRTLMNVSHLEEERNRLATFQRDLLLTRFLVEEQRRFLNQASDTISLPGSLSMGTQTDRHRATQTDVLCTMRPEPRKVKSENDDSSDSDVDCVSSTCRTSRRTICIIGKDNGRHKIRTPIIEESESTEVLRHSGTMPLQRENRSSMLRLTNNRNKIKDVMVNSKLEKYDRVVLRRSNYHRSTTDVSDSKSDQKKVHVSLRDGKKSVSYSNIDDACVLTDKEVYTPRSLKSRMIARRLSASEPPKEGAHNSGHKQQEKDRPKAEKDSNVAQSPKVSVRGISHKQQEKDRQKTEKDSSVAESPKMSAHCTSHKQQEDRQKADKDPSVTASPKAGVHRTSYKQQEKDKQKVEKAPNVVESSKVGAHCASHKQQDAKDRQKAETKDPCAAEWSKKVEDKQKREERGKLKHQKNMDEKEKENVQPESRDREDDTADAENGGKSDGNADGSPMPSVVGAGTLKLKGKNQQLMEKKSVFTIAYDDATTEHLGESSNGSNQE